MSHEHVDLVGLTGEQLRNQCCLAGVTPPQNANDAELRALLRRHFSHANAMRKWQRLAELLGLTPGPLCTTVISLNDFIFGELFRRLEDAGYVDSQGNCKSVTPTGTVAQILGRAGRTNVSVQYRVSGGRQQFTTWSILFVAKHVFPDVDQANAQWIKEYEGT